MPAVWHPCNTTYSTHQGSSTVRLINRPSVNQSINQSINRLISQSINQLINQSIKQRDLQLTIKFRIDIECSSIQIYRESYDIPVTCEIHHSGRDESLTATPSLSLHYLKVLPRREASHYTVLVLSCIFLYSLINI